MKKSTKKGIVLTVVLIAAAVGITTKVMLDEQVKPTFTTDVIKRGDIENVVLTNGVIYASKLVNVGAQVSGVIETIPVKLGDTLKQGDLITQINNLTQKNTLKEAQASLKSINAQYRSKQAQIKEATAEFKRKKAMLIDGATSQSEYDSAESTLAVYTADLDRLSAEKEQALIGVDNAKLDLGYTTIEAPIDGTVIYVSVEKGQTVNASQDTPTIVELAQLDVMTIKAQVSEADVIRVKAGQDVYFTILGSSGKKYHGTLRAIEPGPTLLSGDDSDLVIGDDEAIYYNALFDVENPDHLLRIGMTAQVSIILASSEDALLVPSQVLVSKPGPETRYQVPVQVDDDIEYRDVEVGINNKVYAEILSGLDENELIIVGQSSGQSSSASTMPGGPQSGLGGGQGMRF
jgi:macrolide-specific efflux system membrane fusion protein